MPPVPWPTSLTWPTWSRSRGTPAAGCAPLSGQVGISQQAQRLPGESFRRFRREEMPFALGLDTRGRNPGRYHWRTARHRLHYLEELP